MGDLSAHFSRWEFDCPHCGALEGPAASLLKVLENIRAEIGRPLVIVSGYRCREYNRRVGGIEHSMHRLGYAADIPRGLIKPERAIALGAIGVGHRAGWVIHVDTTPGRRPFTFAE